VAAEALTPEAAHALEQVRVDMATFTSSSTVTHMMALLGDRAESFKTKRAAACIGRSPRTRLVKRAERGGRSREFTIDGLARPWKTISRERPDPAASWKTKRFSTGRAASRRAGSSTTGRNLNPAQYERSPP
jgi:hypothetical protein